MPAIHSTIPVLASLDIGESREFFVERLGFACTLEMPDYLVVVREGCEVHFWRCNDPKIAQNTSCYVRGDTEALHAEFVQRGLQLAPPAVRSWGMKELYVTDPHGNLMKFGESA